MRRGVVFGALWMLCAAAEVSAQAMRSRPRVSVLPRHEFAIGGDQWTYTPESGLESDGWTRWGMLLASRGSIIGQRAIVREDSMLVIADYLETGLGFYSATGKYSDRQAAVIRVTTMWGAQLGRRFAGGTQLVGRAGLSVRLESDAGIGPFVGARVKRGGLGVEGTYIVGDEASVSSLMLRWYPRPRDTGINIAVRWEEELDKLSGVLAGPERPRDRSLMLLFSAER